MSNSEIEIDQLCLGVQGCTITNWSDTFQCKPEKYFLPRSVDEIREILLSARTSKKKVRVIGRCHSPSDLPFTNDYVICLHSLNKVLSIDEEVSQVKAEAGITLAELNDHLSRCNLAMSVLGSVSDVTLGGVISTATHGTGIRHRVISAYILELEIITSSGDLIKCSKDERQDIFYSTLCGLGCIGIIVSAVIQCEPAFQLYQRSNPSTLDLVLDDLDDHLNHSEHFRFLWFPHSDSVSICHSSRVYDVQLPNNSVIGSTLRSAISWFWNYAIGYYGLEVAYFASTYLPVITPWINRIWFTLMYSKPVENIDTSYKVFNFECLFKQYVNEWSIPKEKTQVVLLGLRRFLNANPDIFAHFPVEVRFVAADDIYLSPSYGRDSCYINIIMYRPFGRTIEYQRYWDEYERMMKEAGGRPHWAKAHRETATDLVKMYPYFRAWAQVRKRMDPINMFMNDYMNRIFSTFPKD